MKNIQFDYRWYYSLILLPVASAILALSHWGFVFKSGTAGLGALIIFALYFRVLRQFKDVFLVITAFLFSIAGDWFLSNKNGDSGMFVTGIALFFIAHVGYLAYSLVNGKIHKIFTSIILIVFLAFYFIALYPPINEVILKIAVLIYLLISCLSLGAAVGIKAHSSVKWSYIAGIALVLFSDTIISFNEFIGYKDLNFLILPTYYLAHIFITFSLMRRRELDLIV